MLQSLILIVPFLLLVAAGIVMICGETPCLIHAKIAAYPVGLAFLGAISALVLVTSQGLIAVRFYDPSSVASFIIPIGFHVDRLSAFMTFTLPHISDTAFLAGEVASYVRAADLPDRLFHLIVVMAAVITVLSCAYLYMSVHGRTWIPSWIEGLRLRRYTVCLNRTYADAFYRLIISMTAQLVHRIDKLECGWSR